MSAEERAEVAFAAIKSKRNSTTDLVSARVVGRHVPVQLALVSERVPAHRARVVVLLLLMPAVWEPNTGSEIF